MPSYKVIYFNARARAETTRMLFGVAGVEFEDKRVDFVADWPDMKPNTPWGSLPLMEVDGKQLGQSCTMSRYVAKEMGMAGKTPLEVALAESVFDSVVDLIDKFYKIFFIKDEAEKEKETKEFGENGLATGCANLEKFLCNNKGGKGFFVGDGMTLADLHFFTSFEYITGMFPDVFSKTPTLGALYERIKKDPKVADYLEKRPKSDM